MTKAKDEIFIEGGWYAPEEAADLLGVLWRPISEMPEAYKDGREIIGWDGGMKIVSWMKEWRAPNGFLVCKAGWISIDDTLGEVTHWMPTLPGPAGG